MKPSVAIALIMCGTLLIMTPAAYNYLLFRNITDVLQSRTDMINYTSGQLMSTAYQVVCWISGALMLGVAIVQSLRLPKVDASSGPPA